MCFCLFVCLVMHESSFYCQERSRELTLGPLENSGLGAVSIRCRSDLIGATC